MEVKIKILKDTPFDLAGTVLNIADFRLKYNYISTRNVTDDELVHYIKDYKSFPALSQTKNYCISDWFEVIEIKKNNFKVGDWVWHEKEKKAFTIVHYHLTNNFQKEWRPNYISLEAANTFVEIYKRLATQEEIKYYDLHSFCDGQVLIGEYKCYYFNNVWKELIGIHKHITKYLEYQKEFSSISTLKQFSSEIENSFNCKPNGLKVGCKEILHEDIISIANILKLT
jgi:hypothetical protein